MYSSEPIVAKRSLKIIPIALFDREHRLENREVQVIRGPSPGIPNTL
jgi:hypothetical protein